MRASPKHYKTVTMASLMTLSLSSPSSSHAEELVLKLPKPAKVTKADTEAMAEVREMNVSCLSDGGHPFIKPAAED